MYCEFFGFRELPFTITPNPRFLFLSKNHREAYAHLYYGITNRAGFIALTGEVGSGKTTVIRTLLEQLDHEDFRIALIVNPCLSALELMRSINREYGIPFEGLSDSELLQELNCFLLAENTAGRTVVLVIDEAQNLEPGVLEQVRLISNLETETDKLIQIVLAGQPELGRLLERNELRQLSQRISVRYHLSPMGAEDTLAYIEHRLETAGGRFAVTFFPAAIAKIYRFSGGLPRLINVVCDRALLIAYGDSKRVISDRMVEAAIGEIRRLGAPPGAVWPVRAALAALLAGFCLFFLYLVVLKGGAGTAGSAKGRPVSPGPASAALAPAALSGAVEPSSEAESARRAMAAMNSLWGGNVPVAGRPGAGGNDLRSLASGCGLEVTALRMGWGALRALDVPAVLEVRAPGSGERRYLAMVGAGRDRILLSSQFRGSRWLTEKDLRSVWGGRVHIVWKNYGGIPLRIPPGTTGAAVVQVRKMLEKTGHLKPGTGSAYDGGVNVALKRFQRAHSLEEDGTLGVRTLLLLYRHGGGYPVPRLATVMGG